MISINFRDFDKLLRSKLDVKIPLDEVTETIRKDIETRIKNPQSYDNSSLAPLKQGAYKIRKQKAGKGLLDGFRTSNKLRDSITSEKLNKNHYIVFVGNSNEKIMMYLQEGKSPLAGSRRVFGVSDKALTKINNNVLPKIQVVAD